MYRDLVGTIISWGQRRGHIPRELVPMKGVGVPSAAPGAKRSVRASLRDDDADGDGRTLITSGEMPSRDRALLLGKVWRTRAGGVVDPARRELGVDLAATSGLRWGEQHALRPVDIIWDDAPYISVTRKLVIGWDERVVGTSKPKAATSAWMSMIASIGRPCDLRSVAGVASVAHVGHDE